MLSCRTTGPGEGKWPLVAPETCPVHGVGDGVMSIPTKRANPETHVCCRSLLQKAVRRGHVDLVESTIAHLEAVGDFNWLKGRVGVIVAEECWPELLTWRLPGPTGRGSLPERRRLQRQAISDKLTRVARRRKFKDATGLGTLAFALSQGDMSVLNGHPEDIHIQRLCTAILHRQRYWEEIASSATGNVLRLVENAQAAYRKAGWPWDRAFIQAAAYLAVLNDEVPATSNAAEIVRGCDFPFYVALDKHTPEGKAALRVVSKEMGVSYRLLNWVSFYCESGRVNERSSSPWWKREVVWRLARVGLTPDDAQAIWNDARPRFVALLSDEAQSVRRHVSNERSSGGVQARLAW